MRTASIECIVFLLLTSCGGGGSGDPTDAATESDTTPEDPLDVSDTAGDEPGDPTAEEDAPPDPVMERALLVDSDLLHHAAWLDLEAACESAGIALDYRRFFPHVTEADVTGEDAYDLILVAAGSAPGFASSRLSMAEVDTMVRFVEDGGTLVLLPYPTKLDSLTGENDWYIMNRVLEVLGSGMRIEKANLLGPTWVGSIENPHLDTDYGYATLLEFDIGYAWAFPTEVLSTVLDGPVPAGRATVLQTRGDDISVLLHASLGAHLWMSDMTTRTVIDDRPVSALEPIGDGRIVVVPRFLANLGGASGQMSEHPAHSTSTIARNREFLGWLVATLRDLHEGATTIEPTDPSGGDDPLFCFDAPGFPTTCEGTTYSVAYPPSTREVAPVPPEGDLMETFAVSSMDDPPPSTPLFAGDKGRIGYGGIPGDLDDARLYFSEATAFGLDAYIGTYSPGRLVNGSLSPAEEDALRLQMADIADVAAEEDARWLVGSYYVANFWDPSTMPRATGAQGQEYQAPPLLYEPLWDDYLIPTAVEVATISSTHPGIAGVHIDLEMYGTVLIYNEAHSFDDTTFQVWIDTLTDDGLRAQMLALPLTARLDELVDRGLLSDYLATLHAKAVEIGQRWRAAVDAVDPDTVLSLYLANIPACWQYRGFIEGAGRPDNPVIVVTYDPHTRPARASYVAQGIPMVSLGGPIVSHFPPTEFATVLDNCKEWTDGFWYFSHDEVSAIDHHPLQFGTREEYRTAIASVE